MLSDNITNQQQTTADFTETEKVINKIINALDETISVVNDGWNPDGNVSWEDYFRQNRYMPYGPFHFFSIAYPVDRPKVKSFSEYLENIIEKKETPQERDLKEWFDSLFIERKVGKPSGFEFHRTVFLNFEYLIKDFVEKAKTENLIREQALSNGN